MNNLTKVLLTGVAASMVATVPASARLVTTKAAPVKLHGVFHQKTNSVHRGSLRSTFSYGTIVSYDVNASTAYKVTYDLAAFGFITASSGGGCVNDFAKNKVKIGKPVGVKAKAKLYTVTAATAYSGSTPICSGGGDVTFYGATYEDEGKNGATGTDVISWTDSVKTAAKAKDKYVLKYKVNVL